MDVLYKQRYHFTDLSFLLLFNNEPVHAFLGVISKDEVEIPAISLVNNNISGKANKVFVKEFDRITEEVKGTIWYRDFLIDGKLSTLSSHLLRKGAKTYPHFSQIIDLSQSEPELKRDIRKSYGSLINWGLRTLQPRAYGPEKSNLNHMEDFRQLHKSEAGKETRSKESWEKQFEMVHAGEAFLILAHFEEELISAGLFIHSKMNCYYGVSVSKREMFQNPMFHSIMWTAILHAKKLGCRWFELGDQVFQNHPMSNPPSKKEMGISMFKGGFGGQTRMFLDLKLDCSGGKSNAR